MEIERIDSYVVKVPKGNGPGEAPGYFWPRGQFSVMGATASEALFAKVTSDTGLVGWGEGQSLLAPEATKAVIDRLLAPILIGQNPLEVEKLWDMMYATMRGRGHRTGFMLAAIAALDNALWDLSGKILGVPCHLLLGGRYRDHIHLYNNIEGDTPEVAAQQAIQASEAGFDAVKYHISGPIESVLAKVEAARKAVGPDLDILVDVSWWYDAPQAIALGRGLEQLKAFWLESPVPSEDLRRHAEVPAALDMPVAAGEEFYTPYQFRAALEAHAMDILMPDLARTGLTGGRRIAHLAETFGISVSPHIGGGNVLSTAAAAQFSAGTLNFLIMEHGTGHFDRLNSLLLEEPLVVAGSHLELPDGPGMGIEINEETLMDYAFV